MFSWHCLQCKLYAFRSPRSIGGGSEDRTQFRYSGCLTLWTLSLARSYSASFLIWYVFALVIKFILYELLALPRARPSWSIRRPVSIFLRFQSLKLKPLLNLRPILTALSGSRVAQKLGLMCWPAHVPEHPNRNSTEKLGQTSNVAFDESSFEALLMAPQDSSEKKRKTETFYTNFQIFLFLVKNEENKFSWMKLTAGTAWSRHNVVRSVYAPSVLLVRQPNKSVWILK